MPARARLTLDAVLAVLLAPPCAACGTILERPLDGPVCSGCWRRLPRIAPPWCDRCGAPLDGPARAHPHGCPSCPALAQRLDRARALGPYEGVLRDLVHALKYDRRHSLAPRFAALLREVHAALLGGVHAAVPVPLHWRRHWSRGFNQAGAIAAGLGLPVWPVLRRRRATAPQAGLAPDVRVRNVGGAFALRSRWTQPRRRRLAGTTLLLVDDVHTTGATLDACAAVLKDAGAAEVRALTVARALLRRS